MLIEIKYLLSINLKALLKTKKSSEQELLDEIERLNKKVAELENLDKKSGQRMLSTVDDIVEISKIKTGQLKTNLSKVNIKNHLVLYISSVYLNYIRIFCVHLIMGNLAYRISVSI